MQGRATTSGGDRPPWKEHFALDQSLRHTTPPTPHIITRLQALYNSPTVTESETGSRVDRSDRLRHDRIDVLATPVRSQKNVQSKPNEQQERVEQVECDRHDEEEQKEEHLSRSSHQSAIRLLEQARFLISSYKFVTTCRSNYDLPYICNQCIKELLFS